MDKEQLTVDKLDPSVRPLNQHSIEHLHETNRCRALFATHFHELTALAGKLARLHNATMRVKEWHGDVVFLHEVVAGAADRSYGIQVAKLAGLPKAVIERSRDVLRALEEGREGHKPLARIDDLPLFADALKSAKPEPRGSPVEDAVRTADPDALTPKSALELVYALKRLLAERER